MKLNLKPVLIFLVIASLWIGVALAFGVVMDFAKNIVERRIYEVQQ